MKHIIRILLLLAIILGALYFCYINHIIQFGNNDELKIDKTAVVVEEVKKISELTSVCFYEELVLNEKRENDGNVISRIFKSSTNEIAIIAKGKVRAGLNLSSITDSTLHINGDTIKMTLPSAEIFDVIINPSGFEIFEEDGEWSHEQIQAIQAKAQKQLKQDAINYGILTKADQSGRSKLESLFKSFGYKVVILE